MKIEWRILKFNTAHLVHWSSIILDYNPSAYGCIYHCLALSSEFPLRYKLRSWICSHLQIAVSTSFLVWNQLPPKCWVISLHQFVCLCCIHVYCCAVSAGAFAIANVMSELFRFSAPIKVWGFCYSADEVFAFVGCYTVQGGVQLSAYAP